MWIKTQNKEALVELFGAVKAEVNPNNNDKYTVWMPLTKPFSIVPSISMTLGEYDTAEQALEVLQQIEDRINESCAYVYQMPSANYVQALLDEYEPEWTPVQNINKDENMVDETMIPEIIDEAANAIAQSIDEKILAEFKFPNDKILVNEPDSGEVVDRVNKIIDKFEI